MKGKRNKLGQFNKGSYQGSGFKKTHKPWNKGKIGIHLSEESEFKKGMTPWNKGKQGSQVAWNKGKSKGYINTQGYRVYYMNGKEYLEHRMVMEKYIGRPLLKKEVVHHIDHDRTNNSIFNLKVMSRSQHTRMHKLNKI